MIFRASPRSRLRGSDSNGFGGEDCEPFWTNGALENIKFQYSMTKTKNRFRISNFGHCYLFDICDLLFGISVTPILQQTAAREERPLKSPQVVVESSFGSGFFTVNLLHRERLLSNDFLLFCWYIGQIVFSADKSISLCRGYDVAYSRRLKMTGPSAVCKVEREIPLAPPLQKGDVFEFIPTSSPL
jgi:hypothetical protein